ncbi:MAG TPA: ATP-binding protein [Thermoflexus sp.]|nr:ATP-binding protein [Thermoflexus sp.]
MKSFLRSFRMRLAALVILATLPAWIMVLTTSLEEQQEILQRTSREAQILARVIATQHATFLDTARANLLTIAQIPEVRSGDPQTCSLRLSLLRAAFPYYTAIGRADPDGMVRCSTEPRGTPFSVADRDWFQEAIRRRAFTVGSFTIGRLSGRPALPLAYPMVDAAGQVRGVLAAGLDLGWLNQLATTVPVPSDASMTLLDQRGTILARYPPSIALIGTSFPEALWQAIRSAPEGVGVEGIGPDGKRRLYVSMALAHDSGYALVGIPMSAAIDQANQALARRLAFLGVITLLLAVGAWGAGELMLVQPTHGLLGVIHRIQRGDLQARVGWRSADEWGQLAQAFDALADQLVTQLDALRRAHAALETRDRLLTLSLTVTDETHLYPRLLEEVMAFSHAVGGALYRVEDGRLKQVAERNWADPIPHALDALPPWLSENTDDPPPSLRERGFRSVRRYPLWGPGNGSERPMIGLLVLGFRAPPDPEALRMQDLVETLALAVNHAELLRHARTRLAQVERLQHIDRIILEHADLPVIARYVLESLPDSLQVRAAAVSLLDERRRRARPIAIRRAPGVALDETVFVWVNALLPGWSASPHLIVRTDLKAEPWIQPALPLLEAAGIRTYLGVPLIHQGETIGILQVFSAAPDPLPREALAFAEILAQQLAIAIENLQAFEEARERVEALEAFVASRFEIATAAPDQVIPTFLEALRRCLKVESVAFFQHQPEQHTLTPGGALGISQEPLAPLLRPPRGREGPSPVLQVALTRTPLYIPDTAEEPDGPWSPSIRSVYLIPIAFGPTLFGVAALMASQPEAFPAHRRALADLFAHFMGAALDLARYRAELEATNRMLQDALVVREQMFQNVSHELRTPLTVLMGYLEMLADQAFGPITPEQAEVLRTMQNRAQQLLRYVELMLTLQKVEREGMRFHPLDLRELVRLVGEAWQARLADGPHRLRMELPAGPIWILGDGEGLIRMIGELLDNAVKFSPSGGEIRLSLEVMEGEAVLRVQDPGVGIPREALDRVFEPFYQVDGSTTRRFGGMGIGLAVVKRVVEGHGGAVAVESEPGKGTRVTVRLPMAGRVGRRPPAGYEPGDASG